MSTEDDLRAEIERLKAQLAAAEARQQAEAREGSAVAQGDDATALAEGATQVDTGGGPAVLGDVKAGQDAVMGDKITYEQRSVTVGEMRDVKDSEINIAGRDVIKKETKVIHPDPREIAAEAQAAARQRYLAQLARDCQSLPLVELGSDPDASDDVTLNEVYISLNTTHTVPLTKEEQKKAREQIGREREKRPLTAREAAAQTPRLALLGDPGSGKSTFVRHLLALAGWGGERATAGHPHRAAAGVRGAARPDPRISRSGH